MFKYGRLRHRCAVAILCSSQVIVSLMLVWLAIGVTADSFRKLHIFCWTLQVSLGVSGLFGLFSLCMENSIIMEIFKFLLIIAIVLLMILTFFMVFVTLLFAYKQPELLVFVAVIVFIIVAHIYALASASKLAITYRKGPIQPVPLTEI